MPDHSTHPYPAKPVTWAELKQRLDNAEIVLEAIEASHKKIRATLDLIGEQIRNQQNNE